MSSKSLIKFSSDSELEIKKALRYEKAYIITDENVKNLYLNDLQVYAIKPGEQSKNLQTVMDIVRNMMENKITRKHRIIAVGGGVVGDIAGFVAAIYMRGIEWINVPTSLLAQVDSSIGGKTAVDIDGFKNIVGAFHSPTEIIISLHFLSTLDEREWLCGLGEIYKTALLDKRLYFSFKKNINNFLAKNIAAVGDIIGQCGVIKNKITTKDFRESGLRKTLNLGHTIGHALEKCDNAKLSHGHYVLIGLLAESFIFKDLINEDFYNGCQEDILQLIGGCVIEFDEDALTRAAVLDKKNTDKISVMIATNVGVCREIFVDYETLREGIAQWKKQLKNY